MAELCFVDYSLAHGQRGGGLEPGTIVKLTIFEALTFSRRNRHSHSESLLFGVLRLRLLALITELDYWPAKNAGLSVTRSTQ